MGRDTADNSRILTRERPAVSLRALDNIVPERSSQWDAVPYGHTPKITFGAGFRVGSGG
jgi:hypothetical protein